MWSKGFRANGPRDSMFDLAKNKFCACTKLTVFHWRHVLQANHFEMRPKHHIFCKI